MGGYDLLKILRTARAAGFAEVRQIQYVAFSGGGEAMTQVLSGAITAFSGDFSEVRGFVEAGEMKILAVLAPERLQGFDQYPTAKEQGIDVNGANWRGLYVPKGISDDRFNEWGQKLAAVAESAEWKEAMAANGLAPFTKVGGDFQSWVDGVIADTEELSREIGVIQ